MYVHTRNEPAQARVMMISVLSSAEHGRYGIKFLELGCKLAKLGCNEAGLDCHNAKVKMLSFLTPEGAPNYRKLLISPKQVALVANGVIADFFYLQITPIYFICLI